VSTSVVAGTLERTAANLGARAEADDGKAAATANTKVVAPRVVLLTAAAPAKRLLTVPSLLTRR
jgi:hypothetical protein